MDGAARPPAPRRYAQLLGEAVCAVDGPPTVASDDHEGPPDPGPGVLDVYREGGFPGAADGLEVQPAIAGELRDQGLGRFGTDENECFPRKATRRREPRGRSLIRNGHRIHEEIAGASRDISDIPGQRLR